MNLMIHLLYNTVLLFFLPFYILFSLIQSLFKKKYFVPFLYRLGFLFKRYPVNAGGLWIHAVSVGEIAATVSVIEEIKKKKPRISITISCTTLTGYEMGKKMLNDDIAIIYAPVDLPFVVSRFYKRIKPRLVAVAELEIWPNFFLRAKKEGIPLVLFNGRMPEDDLKMYRIFKSYLRLILDCASVIGVQTETDRKRFIEIGGNKKKVKTTGNIKFDFSQKIKSNSLKKEFLYSSKDRILVVSSTHRGEEELILKAIKDAVKRIRAIKIIFVPRHPHRAAEVAKLALEYGFKPFFRSKDKVKCPSFLILDTIGELIQAYFISELVIIGGSFLKKIQGHNPLEAVFYKKPVIFGPYMENFHNIRDVLLADKGALEVLDSELLSNEIAKTLKARDYGKKLGSAGYRIMSRNKGASKRYSDIILSKIQDG